MAESIHDYTKDDVPFGGDSTDDFEIGDATAERSADEIESKESFTDVPPGDHLLIITGCQFADEEQREKLYKVMLNGRLTSYTAVAIRVRFSLPNNPNCTTSDYFVLPPSEPRELAAYFNGVPPEKKKAGWSASKFIHFINRIGFNWPAGQKLPDEAKRLGNWKGRAVHATVEAGRSWTDDQGVTKAGRPQIKSFSYRPSHQLGGMRTGGSSSTQARTAPAQVRQPVETSAGLDNL